MREIIPLKDVPKLHKFRGVDLDDYGIKDNSWTSFWVFIDSGALEMVEIDRDSEREFLVEDLGPVNLSKFYEVFREDS